MKYVLLNVRKSGSNPTLKYVLLDVRKSGSNPTSLVKTSEKGHNSENLYQTEAGQQWKKMLQNR